MAEGKICDVCQKTKADFICVMCNKDLCKRCNNSPIIQISYTAKPRQMIVSYEVYKMCTFNFCTNCVSKIPWKSKELMGEDTHRLILDQLKKRILAEQIVKGGGE